MSIKVIGTHGATLLVQNIVTSSPLLFKIACSLGLENVTPWRNNCLVYLWVSRSFDCGFNHVKHGLHVLGRVLATLLLAEHELAFAALVVLRVGEDRVLVASSPLGIGVQQVHKLSFKLLLDLGDACHRLGFVASAATVLDLHAMLGGLAVLNDFEVVF